MKISFIFHQDLVDLHKSLLKVLLFEQFYQKKIKTELIFFLFLNNHYFKTTLFSWTTIFKQLKHYRFNVFFNEEEMFLNRPPPTIKPPRTNAHVNQRNHEIVNTSKKRQPKPVFQLMTPEELAEEEAFIVSLKCETKCLLFFQ